MFQQFSKRLVTEQVLSCASADVRRSLWAPPHQVKNFSVGLKDVFMFGEWH